MYFKLNPFLIDFSFGNLLRRGKRESVGEWQGVGEVGVGGVRHQAAKRHQLHCRCGHLGRGAQPARHQAAHNLQEEKAPIK